VFILLLYFLGHLLNKQEGKKKCGKMKEKIMGDKGRTLGRAKGGVGGVKKHVCQWR
jgi:hypothetical protein